MSQRRKERRKKKEKFKGINLDLVKAKLTTLQQGNRLREAIVYAYYNYLMLVQGYFNVVRRPSQTAREFAMDLVKRVKLAPQMIYPFTTLYEEARFGRTPVDQNKYNNALNLFQTLHDQIMGGQKQLGPASARGR